MATPQNSTKVILADTQFLVTESIRLILNETNSNYSTEIVQNYADLHLVLKQAEANLLITDFTMMDYDGFQSIQSIKQKYPSLVILVLTNFITKHDLQELVNAGVSGVMLKNMERDELFAAIETALRGKKYFSSDVLDLFLEQKTTKRTNTYNDATLTSSETEIVQLIAEGLTTKAIADRRNISFHTVMTHRKNIFRKLGVTNASELLMYAVKSGMVDTVEYHI